MDRTSAAALALITAASFASTPASGSMVRFDYAGVVRSTLIFEDWGFHGGDDSLHGTPFRGTTWIDSSGLEPSLGRDPELEEALGGIFLDYLDIGPDPTNYMHSVVEIGDQRFELGLRNYNFGRVSLFDAIQPLATDSFTLSNTSTDERLDDDMPDGTFTSQSFGLSSSNAADPHGYVDLANPYTAEQVLSWPVVLPGRASFTDWVVHCLDNVCTRNGLGYVFDLTYFARSSDAAPVPLPGAVLLFASGLACGVTAIRRRRPAAAAQAPTPHGKQFQEAVTS